MRRHKLLLQKLLVKEIRRYRAEKDMTQEAMAERLHVSTRSLSDLERGVFCLSAASLMFFLLLLPDEEVLRILGDFRALLKGEEEHVVA